MAFASYTLADGRTVFLGVSTVWQTGREIEGELYSPGWMLRRDGPRGDSWTEAVSVREVMELAPGHGPLILERSQALMHQLRAQMQQHGLEKQRVYVELVADFQHEIEEAMALVSGRPALSRRSWPAGRVPRERGAAPRRPR